MHRGSLLPILAFSLPKDCIICEMELIEKASIENVAYVTSLTIDGSKYVRLLLAIIKQKSAMC